MTSPGAVGSLPSSLDPVLVEFWSGFPCPPPWNEGLLFSLNWTSCVSQSVGVQLRGYLAHRCHIPLPPGVGGAGTRGGGGAGTGVEGYERVSEGAGGVVCDTACKALVSVFVSLFLVGVAIAVGVWICRRRRWRGKEMRGGRQQPTAMCISGGGGGDRGGEEEEEEPLCGHPLRFRLRHQSGERAATGSSSRTGRSHVAATASLLHLQPPLRQLPPHPQQRRRRQRQRLLPGKTRHRRQRRQFPAPPPLPPPPRLSAPRVPPAVMSPESPRGLHGLGAHWSGLPAPPPPPVLPPLPLPRVLGR
ncbi:uncharacterized protein LOC143296650 [Babylonia areolata]|uniref:uncharacterized protein LOC143296650 n=1 Tax=Babylonia areolata TaxID=304850 RepID=UPI003FD151EC